MRSKPVDVYVRVSRVGAREHLTSPEDQEREARAFAQSRGLDAGLVLTDLDESGGTLDRPALKRALSRVRSGKSGGIVVAYLSRASRDTRQGLELLEQITSAGGAVYAPNLPDYTSADGRMLTTIQLAIDTGYRQRKSEEFERAKAGAIASGIPVHTRAPVGYRTREDRRLEPDPVIAPIVRQVFERRAQGEGPTSLARFLESNAVTTSQGSRTWSKQAIYNLIGNRTYLGEIRYGRDNRYINAEAHEGVVDLATWTAAQHPNGRLTPSRSGAYLLSGIIRCQACRYALQGTITSRGKRIYRCTRRHAAGVCPEPAWISAEAAESAAVEAFWTITADMEAEGCPDDEGELRRLEDALGRAERQLLEWSSPAVQEAIGDLAEYAQGLRDRRLERDVAADALGKARAAGGAPDVPQYAGLRDAWGRMTVQERRELLGLRFDALALRRDRMIVVWPSGTLPCELPRRGFRRVPELLSFPDAPNGARVLGLEEHLQEARDGGV